MEAQTVDFQVLFNIAIGIIGTVGGWLLNSIWSEIKQLQQNERATTTRISQIEILVAGNYTTKEEFARVMDKVFNKLDQINERLTQKADK